MHPREFPAPDARAPGAMGNRAARSGEPGEFPERRGRATGEALGDRLIWSSQWGKLLPQLVALEAKGQVPPALASRPMLNDSTAMLLGAWNDLAGDITYANVCAWCEACGASVDFTLDVLRTAERHYQKWQKSRSAQPAAAFPRLPRGSST